MAAELLDDVWSVDAWPPATVRTLSTVPVEQVSWLWPGYLPAGKLVVFDGDPSVGKSTCTTDLAARVSTGSAWPDGAASTGPRDVLLLSAEDGLSDTIAPRLTAAQADLTRVHALLEVRHVGENDSTRMVPPSLPRDVPTVERIIAEHQVALVVVDVLMAYLNGRVDSHRDQDVRGVLHQLAAMAERTGATVLLIRHLNKAGGSNALYRGGGSIGIIGAARAAFIIGRDQEDPQRRLFACSKLNLGTEPPTLAYRLISDEELGCARVEWEDRPVEGVTSADLLRVPQDDDERSERDEAVAWLIDYLTGQGGEAPARDVFKAGRGEGLSERTLKRARSRAGVTFERRGFGQGSVWSLDLLGPHSGHSGQFSEPVLNVLNGGPNGEPVRATHRVASALLTDEGSAMSAPLESPLPSTPARCTACSQPLHPAVAAEGSTTHPACGGESR